jgi:hypothetical protein
MPVNLGEGLGSGEPTEHHLPRGQDWLSAIRLTS